MTSKKKVWTIPAIRMKADHAHRIPLTERAMNVLKRLPRLDHKQRVFSVKVKGKPHSGMAMTMQLRRMKMEHITVHRFRSTFRELASEQTAFPHETCERALAHRTSDQAEAAYGRGDQLEKPRRLKKVWAAFCEPLQKSKGVPLHASETF